MDLRTQSAISDHYDLIRPIPQQPGFAAYLEGVDMRQRLTPAVKHELRRALLEFELLLLPAQRLSAEQLTDLASAFGEPAPVAFGARADTHACVEQLVYDGHHTPESAPWRADPGWMPEPPVATVSQVLTLPLAGGCSRWSSRSRAYEALPPVRKRDIDGLFATHALDAGSWQAAMDSLVDASQAHVWRQSRPVSYPLVRMHPDSGRGLLFVNAPFTRCIHGLHYRESRAKLAFLHQWLARPEFTYTHHWQVHGIAIWDTRSTQYQPLGGRTLELQVSHRVQVHAAPRRDAVPVPAVHRIGMNEALGLVTA